MGDETVMRMQERRRRVKLINRLNNLIVLVGLVVASVLIYLQMPEDQDGVKDASVHATQQASPIDGYDPMAATPMPASSDIHDPRVLEALTGRKVRLTRNPLDQFGLSSEPSEMIEASVGEDVRVSNQPSGGAEAPGLSSLSPDEYKDYKEALQHIRNGDKQLKSWRDARGDKAKNLALKNAEVAYRQALSLLELLLERYPEMEAISLAGSDASRGLYATAKHRTE